MTSIILATRLPQSEFFTATATGRSLYAQGGAGFEIRLFPENRAGLPTVYNQAIRESASKPRNLIFIHDDIHLLDYFWLDRVREGLEQFDVVGLAGNRRRVPGQPSWAFVDTKFTWDAREHLSGCVGHGKTFPPANISRFGPSGQRVKLLDGLLLAARSETLLKHNLFFDERFDFHFYDLDFCRQAESKGLRCGTWPIAVMHESGGSFGSPSWQKGYEKYLEKWGD